MKGLVWKIALVTAVLAVGFLVLLQAQRGMTQAMLKKTAEAQETAATDAPPAKPGHHKGAWSAGKRPGP